MKAQWYSFAAAMALSAATHAHDGNINQGRAVFVKTNDAESNEVVQQFLLGTRHQSNLSRGIINPPTADARRP